MTGAGKTKNYTEVLTLRVTPQEKGFIERHCPEGTSLSRFAVSCCMLRCALMDDEEKSLDAMAEEMEPTEEQMEKAEKLMKEKLMKEVKE